MKRIILSVILSVILAAILILPLSVSAYVNPGYGAELTCITSNNTSGYNCNDKTDMFKRIAELEKRLNELETKNCVVVEGSIKLSTLERMDDLERRVSDIEFAIKGIQENIMGGLRNILTFLIIKK